MTGKGEPWHTKEERRRRNVIIASIISTVRP